MIYVCIDCQERSRTWRNIPHPTGCPNAGRALAVLEARGGQGREECYIVGPVADAAPAGAMDAAGLFEEARRVQAEARAAKRRALAARGLVSSGGAS